MKLLTRLLMAAIVFGVAAGPSSGAQPAGAMVREYDPLTGNIRVDLGANIGVFGFEAQGLLKFNEAATGHLVPLTPEKAEIPPAQNARGILAYFSATGLPTGEYLIKEILPKGLFLTTKPTNLRLGFSYTPIGVGSVAQPDWNFAIPEPSSVALASLAFIGIAVHRRRLS